MTKIVNSKNVEWGYDNVANWSFCDPSLTVRIALTLNTLDVLKRCADAQADSTFYFFMNGVLKGGLCHLEESNKEVYLVSEAGYYLPAEMFFHAPYVDLFDSIDKYDHLYDDERILVATFQHVADKVTGMGLRSKTKSEFKAKRSEFLKLLVDEDYRLHNSEDAMLDAFPFLGAFENRVGDGGVDDNTYAIMLFRMREFFSAMTRDATFDNPLDSTIEEEREAHTKWTQKFNSSNLSIYKEPRSSPRRDISYRVNPQAIPS